jgi:hypothetical protein
VNEGQGHAEGGSGPSPRRSGDMRGTSHGGVGAVCPRGAHAMGVGVTVTGMTGGAHESVRGRAREWVSRCGRDGPTGQRVREGASACGWVRRR